jgi:hypothetical protein
MAPKRQTKSVPAVTNTTAESVAASATPECDAPRILLVNSGPVWLEADSTAGDCHVNINRIFGPGVTLQTLALEQLASLPSGAGFDHVIPTAGPADEVAALLPGPDGNLMVVPNGAYSCVRLAGSVRHQ